MRPTGRPGELFSAFSRIIVTAFRDERLLSCPNLSRAPNYGSVLRRFLLRAPCRPMRFRTRCRLAVRYVVANGLHLGFMLLGALFLRLLKWGTPSCLQPDALRSLEKPLFFIDTFAVLPKVAGDKVFQDLYMPGLAEAASNRGREVVFFYRLYGSRNPLVLWNSFRVLAAKGNGLTELHLLRWSDWLRLLRHCLVYPFSLRRLIRSLEAYPDEAPESAIRQALRLTAGQCILIGEARRLAARRLGLLLASAPLHPSEAAVQGGSPGRTGPDAVEIVSWYENQTLNKTFQHGLAQAEDQTGRHVPVTGAQLFIWPDTLLNNHPDDEEMRIRLTPDRILVNGPHFLPETTQQSYSVGPSLRYGDLFASGKMDVRLSQAASADSESNRNSDAGERDESARSGPLLVLFSYHPEEIGRVLNLVLPLANRGRYLMYKFHPATRPEDYAALLPHKPLLAEGSLKDALCQAGAVLGSGSGALAEAAAQGIFVLHVEDASGSPGLSLNYLPDYGKGVLWTPVRCPEDIEKALASAKQRDGKSQGWKDAVENFRRLLFTEPTPERIRKDFRL